MNARKWTSTAVPLLAALISGLIGAGYGGYLSTDKWRYERTLDAYSELIAVVDRALIFISDLPKNATIGKSLAQQGMREDAIRYIEGNSPGRFYELLIQARRPALFLEALQPHRAQHVWNWLGRLNDIKSKALAGSAVLASTGDSTDYLASCQEIEQIRREILDAEKEDSGRSAPFRFSKMIAIAPILCMGMGLVIGMLGTFLIWRADRAQYMCVNNSIGRLKFLHRYAGLVTPNDWEPAEERDAALKDEEQELRQLCTSSQMGRLGLKLLFAGFAFQFVGMMLDVL